MNKGQGLPITSVVLVIIAVVVVTVFIIYILTTSGKGFDITQNYWSSSGNLTKNASAQGGQPAKDGTIVSCKANGKGCTSTSECCDEYARCYKTAIDSSYATCNYCVIEGYFCNSGNDCCSDTPKCINAGLQNAYCSS